MSGNSTGLLILAAALAAATPVGSSAASAGSRPAKGLAQPDLIFRDGVEEYVDLSGHAGFLEPLAGALVTLSSQGGRTVQGLSDGTGAFHLRYEMVGPGAPLQVRVQGVDAQSEQEYAAWLGDPAFLLARAGSDRILDQADLPALRVNAFQTGRYLAISALPASEHTPPGREAERLAASYNWRDAYDRSAIIALLMSGELPFPVGAATTLDAVSQLSTAQALHDDYYWGTYDFTTLHTIGSDPQHVPLHVDPPFGRTLQSYETFSTHGSAHVSTRVRFEPDGTGSFGSGTFAEQPVLWTSTPEGYFRVTAADGGSLAVEGAYYYYSDCNCQRLEERHYVAARIGIAEGPRGNLLLAVTFEEERRFPEEPARPVEPAPSYHPVGLATALVDDTGLAAFEDPSGEVLWLRAYVEDGDYPHSRTEPHRFEADGTGVALHRSLSFTWQIDTGGNLHIVYGNGAESTTVRASADREYGSTTVVYRTAMDVVIPDSGNYLRQQPEMDFNVFDPVGRTFLTRVNCDMPFAEMQEPCRDDFGFTFAADLTGTMVGAGSVLEWEVGAAGDLVIRRYDPDGTLTQLREWTLISTGPSSVLVFERIALPDGFELDARVARYTF